MSIPLKGHSSSPRRWQAGLLSAVTAVGLLSMLPSQAASAAERPSASTAALTPADDALARRYAPKIYLQQDESYFPSNVELLLANTHTETHPDDDNPNQQFLVTNQPLGCNSCTDPSFLTGQRPGPTTPVPAYAEVVHRTDNGRPTNITDIIYWTHYPYNNGKRVCIGVYTRWGCAGGYSTFGNHVGDWENATIRFVGTTPYQISLSQHDHGQTFLYGSKDVALSGEHPVLYAAQGSHGLYADAGRHTYRTLPNGDSLNDDTSAGTLWDTQQALKVFPWQTVGSYTGEWSWLNYTGRWGNPKSGCSISEPLTGECVLNDGPKAISATTPFDPHMQALDGAPGLLGATVASIVADGNRTGLLTTDGNVYVKEGAIDNTGWVLEYAGATSLALSGNRIGIITKDAHAYVKEGGLSTAWVDEYAGATSVALSGDRIGVIAKDGNAYAKEGGLSTGWLLEYAGATSLALSGNRIGVIAKDGNAYAKEGDLRAGWVLEYAGATSMAVSGNRIGVIAKDAHAYVKEGGLSTAWVDEYAGATSVALSGNRIGVMAKDGNAYAKEGDLHAGWVLEYAGATSLALSGNRIGVIANDASAYVKEGGLNEGWALQNFIDLT